MIRCLGCGETFDGIVDLQRHERDPGCNNPGEVFV
jgi:hypothetical protein